MKTAPTATIEDYLGIIYTLERDGEKVIGARLAEILDVSPPTVTVTLQRMVRDGWISLDEKKNVHLTASGREASRSVIRRHMLTEWLLSRVLHVPLSELHDEAHRIEHTISDQVEQQLISTMEDPEVCPHGNPLPGQEDAIENWQPLTNFTSGDVVAFRRIHELLEEDHGIMTELAKSGIEPGKQAEITEHDPQEKKISIRIGERAIPLVYETAQRLFVEAAQQ